MELPINRPSQMSYADEVDFNGLLGKLKSERFNGFIRVTSGSAEGYILFREGKQSASSFESYSKAEAVEKIKSIVNDSKTLIEVFNVKKSQMDYIMDLNKFFVIDSDSKVDDILDELKNTEYPAESYVKKPPLDYVNKSENTEDIPNVEKKSEDVSNKKTEDNNEVREKLKAMSQRVADENNSVGVVKELEIQSKPSNNNSEEINAPMVETLTQNNDSKLITEEAQYIEKNEFMEPGVGPENVDREELMKKYGLEDISEEEVGSILETYKGGSLSDEDVEKIELMLMNKIKKSIFGVPKIRGSEVMVSLDNTSKPQNTEHAKLRFAATKRSFVRHAKNQRFRKLSGTANITIEYKSKGLLSRIMGESRDLENLKRQIINITQMEVKKSFKEYPEIVDDFVVIVWCKSF